MAWSSLQAKLLRSFDLHDISVLNDDGNFAKAQLLQRLVNPFERVSMVAAVPLRLRRSLPI